MTPVPRPVPLPRRPRATAAAVRTMRVEAALAITVVAGIALVGALLAVALVVVAAAAGAQTTTTAGGAPAATPISTNAANPGGIVFFGVSLVIAVGALTLYLRHRPARTGDPVGG